MRGPTTVAIRNTSRAGFTLIELSIVLVIIGLIVGGILVGQDLIRAAEIRATLRQMEGFQSGVNAFRIKYNYLPGDMPIAERYWGSDASCPNTPTNEVPKQETCNGTGNGIISDMNPGCSSTVSLRYERFRAWQHLANAGLIQGAYSGVTGPKAPASLLDHLPGINAPTAKTFGATYSLVYENCPAGTVEHYPVSSGHYILFGAPSDGTGAPVSPAIRADEALSMDQKIDDGRPGSGKMLAPPPTGTWAPDCATAGGGGDEYNIGVGGLTCSLKYKFV